jgi:hypothetical protein
MAIMVITTVTGIGATEIGIVAIEGIATVMTVAGATGASRLTLRTKQIPSALPAEGIFVSAKN